MAGKLNGVSFPIRAVQLKSLIEKLLGVTGLREIVWSLS